MAEFTNVEKFKAATGTGAINVKEVPGTIMTPVADYTYSYIDAQGKEHNVLVLKGEDGTMYRTEVAAFIDKYLKYKDAFGDLADEEKPKIVFSPRKSRAGNNYTDFDVQDIDG